MLYEVILVRPLCVVEAPHGVCVVLPFLTHCQRERKCMIYVLEVLMIVLSTADNKFYLGAVTDSVQLCLQVQREHHLPPGDFPDLARFRDILSAFEFDKFPKLSKSMVRQIEDVMSVDIPNLVRAFDNPYQ